MSPGYLFYNFLASLAAPLAIGAAAAKGRLTGNWTARLGFGPPIPCTGRHRIWVHAVSSGEIQVAAALIRALERAAPELDIWLSTTTASGRLAATTAGLGQRLLTFPLDFYGSPGRALDRISPDLVVLLETELWPNFLQAARARGIRTMLANGRISVRSVSRYRRVRFLMAEVLSCLDLMAMIQPGDAERIISLGAATSRVLVAGNAKYDLLFERRDQARAQALRAEITWPAETRVLVAGSTRSGEESLIIEAFRRLRQEFPGLGLVLAPRHVERSREIETLIRDQGLSLVRRSVPEPRLEVPDVVLVDVMGELFSWYGLADVAFCGASLVSLGGQNPLEPAVWGVPVLYGPSMEDFSDARQWLESVGGGRTVADGNELVEVSRELLADPDRARAMGRAGQAALAAHQGVAERLAGLALGLLDFS